MRPGGVAGQTTDALDMQIWTDVDGARVPTTEVASFPRSEHCDWQRIKFLWLGVNGNEDPGFDAYLRDTRGELADFLPTTSTGGPSCPPARPTPAGSTTADSSGWAPTPRAAYLVSVDDATDVERWPAEKEHIGCA